VPTTTFYFRVPLEAALRRILVGRPKLKWYEAGMDLGLDADVNGSYQRFQGLIQTEYEQIVAEYGLASMDATLPVEAQQRALRELVRPHLGGVARDPGGEREAYEDRTA